MHSRLLVRGARLLCVFVALWIVGCGGQDRAGSAADAEQLAELRVQLVEVEQRLADAEELTFGSKKTRAVLAARIEVLRITRDLLAQRILALESGARLEYTVQVAVPDLERAAEMREEIEALAGAIPDASRPAADRVRLAQLRLEELRLRYGLYLQDTVELVEWRRGPTLPKPPPTPSPRRPSTPPPPSTSPRSQADKEEALTVIFTDAKEVESTPSYTLWSWIVSVRNTSEGSIRFDLTLEFHDVDGYTLKNEKRRDQRVRGWEEKELSGTVRVSNDLNRQVAGVRADCEVD